MVRRTREQALETRDRILDAAEGLFLSNGVSRTSLAEIADSAGVTRGAIYWHFANKPDLFIALIERVVLPIEKAVRCVVAAGDPIGHIRACARDALRAAAREPRSRAVFEIISQKTEYVGEMSVARDRQLEGMTQCLAHVSQAVACAMGTGCLPRTVDPCGAAIGLHALIDGLIRNWLLGGARFDLEREGGRAIEIFLAGLGAREPAPIAAAAAAVDAPRRPAARAARSRAGGAARERTSQPRRR
jgi:TetR/AcrR family acrAB operon transcriptional repressor